MRTTTGLIVACMIVMLSSAAANAVPIAAGTANLYRDSGIQIFDIDASGYHNLFLEFSAIAGGTIDRCGDFFIADCLSVNIDGQTTVMSGLSVTNDWQSFGPVALPLVNHSFDLVFDAHITGADEDIVINWVVAGERTEGGEDSRVIVVSEPSMIALLILGLAGFARARRQATRKRRNNRLTPKTPLRRGFHCAGEPARCVLSVLSRARLSCDRRHIIGPPVPPIPIRGQGLMEIVTPVGPGPLTPRQNSPIA